MPGKELGWGFGKFSSVPSLDEKVVNSEACDLILDNL